MLELLPSLNRRRLLIGLAAASTAASIPAVAIATAPEAPAENPELIRLGDAFDGVLAEYHAATAAYWNIVKVWQPRMPRAPEAITYDGSSFDSRKWEKSIHGFGVLPDGTVYDHNRPRDTPRSVEVASYYAEVVKRLRKDMVRKRPKHPLSALDVAEIELEIGLMSDKLALATAYEAERARVVKASGFDAAEARKKAATEALTAIVGRIMDAEEITMAGVVIKAEIMEVWSKLPPYVRALSDLTEGWGGKLAASILRIASQNA